MKHLFHSERVSFSREYNQNKCDTKVKSLHGKARVYLVFINVVNNSNNYESRDVVIDKREAMITAKMAC